MSKLTKLTLRGFNSIKDATIDFGSMNVLIGANGAGKSSLVSFFRLLNEMMGERLQQFIAQNGRAQSLLTLGPKRTPQIHAELEFATNNGVSHYIARWFHAAGDTLVFAEETLRFQRAGSPDIEKELSLGPGHFETLLRTEADKNQATAKIFRHLLNTCRVYHFHDTSSTARVRQSSYVSNNSLLMYDAANLAPFLLALRNDSNPAYRRIVSTIQLVAPFFDDFDLQPEGRDIFLNWREKGSDLLFGPHQLSDGTLRAICLITLLLQPEEKLPSFIVVDEPELGLHPYALSVIAALFYKAAAHTQILVSTQSSTFLDHFDPNDVIVVNRTENGSVFSRPDAEKLDAWLDEYSLGEVWEKNVIAGGPH